MIVGENEESLRPSRPEMSLLVWAFAISLFLHLLTYGTYTVGKQLGWWNNFAWPAWMRPAPLQLTAQNQSTPKEDEQIPQMFIETTPIQSVAEAPKDAKYYSDKNTAAANPDTDRESNDPKIDGNQTRIAKTEDTKRQYVPLQPSPPTPELRARPKETTGDLAFASKRSEDDGEGRDDHTRPRRLEEVEKTQPTRIVGEKMKQDGGVKRRLAITSVDAKATTFGGYDAAFIEAVQQRWYDLLEARDFIQGRRGHVTLNFILHYDGRITDLVIKDSDVGEMLGLLCQKAVLDPAPFARWPSDMQRTMGDSRRLQFTFYYE